MTTQDLVKELQKVPPQTEVKLVEAEGKTLDFYLVKGVTTAPDEPLFIYIKKEA